MDDSTGSDADRGRTGRATGGDAADGAPADADPDDREVFRRGHAPGDEPRIVDPEREATDAREPGAEGGNVAGPSPGSVSQPVEPGSPSAENVFFVLLGVALTLFVLVRMAGL